MAFANARVEYLGYHLKKDITWKRKPVSSGLWSTQQSDWKKSIIVNKPNGKIVCLPNSSTHAILLERSNFVGEFKIRVSHLHKRCRTLSLCGHVLISSTELFPRDLPRESTTHGSWNPQFKSHRDFAHERKVELMSLATKKKTKNKPSRQAKNLIWIKRFG